MAGTTTMAKKQAKPKPASAGGTTRAFRMSQEYADWLELVASKDRSTIAALMDRALAYYAEAIGVTEPPPDRV